MESLVTTPSAAFREAAQEKFNNKTKPLGSLGMLEALAVQAAGIQQSLTPGIERPCVLVFAADHGIAREAVSAYPQEVTGQMVLNFVSGGAAISVLCRLHDIGLKVINAGVNGDLPEQENILNRSLGRGTKNFLVEPAMTREQATKALSHGATCEGHPGLRPHYHPDYYGAYFRDLDGNKICVVCHLPEFTT